MARDRRVEHLSCGLEPQAQPIYQSRIVRTLEIAVDEKCCGAILSPQARAVKPLQWPLSRLSTCLLKSDTEAFSRYSRWISV